MKKLLSLALTSVLCLNLAVPVLAAGKTGDTTIMDAKGNTHTLSNPILYTITCEDVQQLNRDSLNIYFNGEPFKEEHFNMTASEYFDGFFSTVDTVYALPTGTEVTLSPNVLTDVAYALEISWKNGIGYADNYYVELQPGFSEMTLNGDGYIMSVSLESVIDDEQESGLLNDGGTGDFGGSKIVEPDNFISFYVPTKDMTTNPFASATPTNPTKPSKTAFTDVSSNDYYADSVNWALEKSITSGTSATTFSPDQTCTTAQIITFLWKANGSPEPISKVNPFTDVKENDYFYKAALWAKENKVLAATDKNFNGNKPCTRSMAVLYIWRAKGFRAAEKTSNFTDVAPTTIYAPAVDWAVEHGVTGGTSATTFSPDNTCTRAQIVTFLYKAYK